MKKQFYIEKLSYEQAKLKKLDNTSKIFSLLRLIIFILVVSFLSLAFFDKITILYYLVLVLLIIFSYLLYLHNNLIWKKQLCESRIDVLEKYLKRFSNTWQEFDNKGFQFINNCPFVAKDLDIIGNNSLFQYINLAKSKTGQERLYNSLIQNNCKRYSNKAISELANKKDIHLSLTSLVNMYNQNKSEPILNDDILLNNNTTIIYKFLTYIYGPLSILFYLLMIFNLVDIKYLSIISIVNVAVFLIGYLKNTKYLHNLTTFNNDLWILKEVLTTIENEEFIDESLLQMQEIVLKPKKVSVVLSSVIKLIERVNSKNNFLIYILANIVFLWDYQNVYLYDKWKKDYQCNIDKYLDLFYDIEVMLSLGVIEQTKTTTTIPIVKDNEILEMNIDNLYHPLLKEENVVMNNFKGKSGVNIITGSNMSGKTTFIRAIGLNHILAYAGASVCSTSFITSKMKVLTSIRVEDDFNQGISTFYAEINRIKEMIETINRNEKSLVLIDEIFKGTNSQDRIYGATKAIDKLNNQISISFVTTHDEQLTKINNVCNFHFKEYYENNKIKFNYKMYNGVSTTKNAKYLLKLAGIDE